MFCSGYSVLTSRVNEVTYISHFKPSKMLVVLFYFFVSLVKKLDFKKTQNFKESERHSQSSFISEYGPRSAVGNMSGYRCVSDCKSRGREFDPGPVPYFRGDRS